MSEKPRVFVSRAVPPQTLARLEVAELDLHIWDAETPPPCATLLDELALADGIITMLTEQVNREALDAAPKLRVISNFAVGVDNIDLDLAAERGIPVGHTPGVLTEATADQAFMLLLACARRLVESVAYVKAGEWQTWFPMQMLGHDVSGRTLGIIGLGRIGHAMAKRGRGFGMKILYHGGSRDEFARDVDARAVDLETLLRESDFVSVHAPLKDETRHLLSTDQFALMKQTAILVNTARGGIIDTEALVAALREQEIAYAGLDVTDPEPLPADHALLGLDNCIVVPHLGSATWSTRERIGEIAVQNLLLGLRGERLIHCANPAVYQA